MNRSSSGLGETLYSLCGALESDGSGLGPLNMFVCVRVKRQCVGAGEVAPNESLRSEGLLLTAANFT